MFGKTTLRMVSYSITPIRGVPSILASCINYSTPHSCRCLWGGNSFSSGPLFEGDFERSIDWNRSPDEAETVLREADVVIVHAGRVEPRHRSLLAGKAVVTMAHSYLHIVDQTFIRQGYPGVVLGQSWATLPEYKGWIVVPSPIPWWENALQPGEKGEMVTICYTPFFKTSAPSTNLFSKGYRETMRILERLVRILPMHLEVIGNQHVPHEKVLAMKRRSHIVIDECVTGGYHRNSLEGLATGCVVVNGVGLVPEVVQVLYYCTGGKASNPFVFASLETLEGVLTWLIERGAASLKEEGERNRRWMERYWDFAWQWDQFWMPAVRQAIQVAGQSNKA